MPASRGRPRAPLASARRGADLGQCLRCHGRVRLHRLARRRPARRRRRGRLSCSTAVREREPRDALPSGVVELVEGDVTDVEAFAGDRGDRRCVPHGGASARPDDRAPAPRSRRERRRHVQRRRGGAAGGRGARSSSRRRPLSTATPTRRWTRRIRSARGRCTAPRKIAGEYFLRAFDDQLRARRT